MTYMLIFSLFLPSFLFCLPVCVSVKANLVAAFEQSLALMTARLQTLSVSSEQKVFHVAIANEDYTRCPSHM